MKRSVATLAEWMVFWKAGSMAASWVEQKAVRKARLLAVGTAGQRAVEKVYLLAVVMVYD